MFVVFYTVSVYVCIMTCSTSCCLRYTLMDPWNVCMYVFNPLAWGLGVHCTLQKTCKLNGHHSCAYPW